MKKLRDLFNSGLSIVPRLPPHRAQLVFPPTISNWHNGKRRENVCCKSLQMMLHSGVWAQTWLCESKLNIGHLGMTNAQASWLAQVGPDDLIGQERVLLCGQTCTARRLLACASVAIDSMRVRESTACIPLLHSKNISDAGSTRMLAHVQRPGFEPIASHKYFAHQVNFCNIAPWSKCLLWHSHSCRTISPEMWVLFERKKAFA